MLKSRNKLNGESSPKSKYRPLMAPLQQLVHLKVLRSSSSRPFLHHAFCNALVDLVALALLAYISYFGARNLLCSGWWVDLGALD